jgi:hypothetical protein
VAWSQAVKRLFASALLLAAGCKHYDLSSNKDQIAIGKRYVAERGCADCHQSADKSAGILSGQTTPQPGTMAYGSNLTPDVATGLGGWADIEIVRAMRDGVDKEQMPLCPTMPRFDGSLGGIPAMTDLEANAIVAYLRSLPAVSSAIPKSVCPPIKPPELPDMSATVGGGDDLSVASDGSTSD